MFSIGVTLLEVLTLRDCNILYTRTPYSLNIELLEKFKSDLRNSNYSEHLKQLLTKMIEIKPELRPRAS